MTVDDSYSKVLLHMDGSDTSTTFTDESGKTWTAAGNAQIDTAQKVFGTASGLFDGTGDYISTPNSADFDFGTGDWTIDFRVRRNGNQASYNGIISGNTSSVTGWEVAFGDGANNKICLNSKASGSWVANELLSTTALSNTTWYHVAIVRNGNTAALYINGTSEATKNVTGYTYNSSGSGLVSGRLRTNTDGYYLTGWIDELRISKGIARWTGNFTPPTAAYVPPYMAAITISSTGA
jgi:hypothetical protein